MVLKIYISIFNTTNYKIGAPLVELKPKIIVSQLQLRGLKKKIIIIISLSYFSLFLFLLTLFFFFSLVYLSLFSFSFFLSFSGSSLCSFLFLSSPVLSFSFFFSHFSFLFSLSLRFHGFGGSWLWWWLILGVSFLDFGGGFLGFCGGWFGFGFGFGGGDWFWVWVSWILVVGFLDLVVAKALYLRRERRRGGERKRWGRILKKYLNEVANKIEPLMLGVLRNGKLK